MADKLTSDQITELFKDEYFQYRFWRAIVTTAVLLVSGSGTAGYFLYQHFSTQFTELQTGLKGLKTQDTDLRTKLADALVKVDAATGQAKASSQLAAQSAVEAGKQVQSIGVTASGAAQSAQLAGENMRIARESIDTMRESMSIALEQRAQRLTTLAGEISEKASRLEKMEKKLLADGQVITKTATQVGPIEKQLESLSVRAANFTKAAGQLSTFKTFEIVTLRSRSDVKLEMKDVRPEFSDKPVPYALTFSTSGLRNVGITVSVDSLDRHWSLTFVNVDVPKGIRPTYCLMGTPWMFQGDNYVQSWFVKDFVTLKIVAALGGCIRPNKVDGNPPPFTASIQ